MPLKADAATVHEYLVSTLSCASRIVVVKVQLRRGVLAPQQARSGAKRPANFALNRKVVCPSDRWRAIATDTSAPVQRTSNKST